ncbi:MAG: dialkylresorcinol condensing enzyme [Thiobacillus sp.]|nr:dialkylresorcinol condensing enzyme [Thiobacillus sp.]
MSSSPPHPGSTRNKKVLAVVYSQTGQLSDIAERMLAPLQADPAIGVHIEVLRPAREHPYPWPFLRFLDTFPESAHMVPEKLHPLTLANDADFDLVLVFYQVWFLAPSRPVVAFLDTPVARAVLRGKPVVTVIACRNMWLQAHARMHALLSGMGARLLDNVVLTDRSPTLTSLLTTPLWLLTGRKKPVPGLPAAGVAAAEIRRSIRFGRALRDALHADREQYGAPLLSGLEAVEAEPKLLVSERAGSRSFYWWGKLLRLAGPPGAQARKPLLIAYVMFLFAIIVTIVPLSLTLQALFRPLLKRRLAALKAEFERPSGSGTERLAQYDY